MVGIIIQIISLTLLIIHFYTVGIILLSISILIQLYMLIPKRNGKKDVNKYIITYQALNDENLKKLIEHNLLKGEFFVSKRIVSDSKEKKNQANRADILFNNLSVLRKKAHINYVESGHTFSDILSYAYKNECIVISSGESVSRNISKIFNVSVIDIGFLKAETQKKIETGSVLKVYAYDKNEDGVFALLDSNTKVCIKDSHIESGQFVEVTVENILEMPGEKVIYAREKH